MFNDVFIDEGGLLITKNELYNRFLKKGNQYISGISGFGKYIKNTPEVYFNFINNPLVNAKAAIKDKTGLIGFYGGGFMIIYDLFLKNLSHTDTLMQIGAPKIEKFSVPIIRNYYSDANLLVNFGNFDYEPYKQSIPIDKSRSAYAYLLFNIAFEFILNHELTHILNGHVSFVDSNPDYNNNLTFQTLEMDADCISISKILARHVRIYKGIIKGTEEYHEFYTSLNSVIYFIYYSICTLFRIFADNAVYKLNTLTNLSHSKPRIRQVMAGATILEYFNNYFVELRDELDLKVLGEVTAEVEKNYMSLTGLKIDIKDYEEASSIDAKEQTRQILEHWETIRFKLTDYSYVELV